MAERKQYKPFNPIIRTAAYNLLLDMTRSDNTAAPTTTPAANTAVSNAAARSFDRFSMARSPAPRGREDEVHVRGPR